MLCNRNGKKQTVQLNGGTKKTVIQMMDTNVMALAQMTGNGGTIIVMIIAAQQAAG
jgi:hypothetical protein